MLGLLIWPKPQGFLNEGSSAKAQQARGRYFQNSPAGRGRGVLFFHVAGVAISGQVPAAIVDSPDHLQGELVIRPGEIEAPAPCIVEFEFKHGLRRKGCLEEGLHRFGRIEAAARDTH